MIIHALSGVGLEVFSPHLKGSPDAAEPVLNLTVRLVLRRVFLTELVQEGVNGM